MARAAAFLAVLLASPASPYGITPPPKECRELGGAVALSPEAGKKK